MAVNSTTITSLPGDIICELFDTLADIDPPQCAGRWSLYADERQPSSLGWIKLTHVSRRLREIGLTLPTLWARVVCVFPSGCEDILMRAKDAPLTLDLRAGGLVDYFHLLSTHGLVHRISHARDIHFEVDLSRRAWWKGEVLPQLKTLRLEYEDVRDVMFLTIHALNRQGVIHAPALRSYEVVGGFVPFRAPALRTLIIGYSVPWPALQACLWSSPLLSTLSVAEVRRFVSSAHRLGHPIALTHLTRLSILSPSDMGVIDLLSNLVIPSTVVMDMGNCLSPAVFHALLERRTGGISGDMLNVSAAQIRDSSGRYSRNIRLSVAEYIDRPYHEYRCPFEDGITYEKRRLQHHHGVHHEENLLTQALIDILATPDSRAASIRALAFNSTRGRRNETIDPLPVTMVHLIQLRAPLLLLTGVTTIYTSRMSVPLYNLLPTESGPVLFPSLKTVILDVCSARLEACMWLRIINVLAFLEKQGRPLDRFVLMGSHLCHLAPDMSFTPAENIRRRRVSRVKVEVEHVSAYVGEVVDMRDNGCTCPS